jgi:hypothetical protein
MAWTPLFSAAVAHEAAMSPPHFRMEIRIQALHNWAHWRDASVEHLRPAPKVLENADGKCLSVKQFIEAVHEYAVPPRTLLLRCMDVDNPEDWDRARFWFECFMGARASGGKADENTRQEVAIVCWMIRRGMGEKYVEQGECGDFGQEEICCKVKWGCWKTSRRIQGYTSVTVSQVN